MAIPLQTGNSDQPPKKVDLFHPQMPQIPGLEGIPPLASRQPHPAHKRPVKTVAMTATGLLLAIGVALVWWSNGRNHAPVQAPVNDVEATPASAPAAALPLPVPSIPTSFDGTTRVGTAEELSSTWASKKFVFAKPFTREQVDAIAVRLPGGALWAFALQEPNGRCELEYTTDLHRIATEFRYRAVHPMVVNPCNGTVYDPLKVGSLGGDILVRGDIVKGDGARPPIAIDVARSGKFIVADRIE